MGIHRQASAAGRAWPRRSQVLNSALPSIKWLMDHPDAPLPVASDGLASSGKSASIRAKAKTVSLSAYPDEWHSELRARDCGARGRFHRAPISFCNNFGTILVQPRSRGGELDHFPTDLLRAKQPTHRAGRKRFGCSAALQEQRCGPEVFAEPIGRVPRVCSNPPMVYRRKFSMRMARIVKDHVFRSTVTKSRRTWLRVRRASKDGIMAGLWHLHGLQSKSAARTGQDFGEARPRNPLRGGY